MSVVNFRFLYANLIFGMVRPPSKDRPPFVVGQQAEWLGANGAVDVTPETCLVDA
jgi:hypothetical protein